MNTVSAKHQLNEKLDWIAMGKTFEEQVERAKYVAQIDTTFPIFMRMAAVSREGIMGLPEGMPDTYKPETDIPEGISDTTARQEFRRIRNFTAEGTLHEQAPARRENLWLQLLEGMHWKEAAILIQIKDRTLFHSYPNMYEVMKTLGTPVDCPSPTEKLPKSKKKAK